VKSFRWPDRVNLPSYTAYNDTSLANMPNWQEVISNRLTITGYIVTDFVEKWPETVARLARAVQEGTIVVEGGETVCEVDFEKVPDVWKGLFTGINRGKLVTKLV
jgi:NADPH-dependent curcumin reductase CurA